MTIVVTYLAFIMIAVMGMLLVLLVISGRENRKRTTLKSHPVHITYAWRLVGATAVEVVLVEIRKWMIGHLFATDLLFWTHLTLALSFVAMLFLLIKYVNGERSRMHRQAAYLLIMLYLGMAGTAVPLLTRSTPHRPSGYSQVSVFYLFVFGRLSMLAQRYREARLRYGFHFVTIFSACARVGAFFIL